MKQCRTCRWHTGASYGPEYDRCHHPDAGGIDLIGTAETPRCIFERRAPLRCGPWARRHESRVEPGMVGTLWYNYDRGVKIDGRRFERRCGIYDPSCHPCPPKGCSTAKGCARKEGWIKDIPTYGNGIMRDGYDEK